MQFGGPAVLRRQPAGLLDQSERPNGRIRAVPFDVATVPGAGENHTPAAGPIPELDTVQVDLTHGPEFLHHGCELRAYRGVMAAMEQRVMSAEVSRDFIHRVLRKLKG
ncbi:DNA-binding protein [Kitasatospora acidiphila]|uniref:DNA-binding protein n=1 Tax=Kitasatospora acidiphila TaxID=2567942 RepID=A0A540W3S8_9ACTN|nr:DNA-binding protein [Kitasatospora acidiphila]